MDEATRDKIIRAITKSGFPLELELVEKLKDHFQVFPNVAFRDKEGDVHEIDILGFNHNMTRMWSKNTTIQLLVECKKSTERCWVFFEEVFDSLDHTIGLGFYAVDYSTNLFNKGKILNPLIDSHDSMLQEHHFSKKSIPRARTHLVVSKNGNESDTKKANSPSAIYDSIQKIFFARDYFSRWLLKSSNRVEYLYFKHYTIVFDGELTIAKRVEQGFEVSEVNHILLKTADTVHIPSENLLYPEIVIDIIQKDYFSEYIRLLNQNLFILDEHLSILEKTGKIKLSDPPIGRMVV